MKNSPSKRTSKKAASLAAILFLAVSATGGPGQEFTLRTRVDLVVVPFSVMTDGRFVAGLGAEDFVVREDGRLQVVEEFSTDPVPLSAVLLIDTGLIEQAFRAVSVSRSALVRAFNLTEQHRLIGAADEVAVYRYDNRVSLVLDFTDDEAALRASLEWMENAGGGVGLVGGPGPGIPVVNGVPIEPRASTPVTGDKRVLHDAINEAALALRLRDEGRRKVILLVSDGRERESEIDYDEVQLRLLETEVQVFAIHVRTGLVERLLGDLTSRLDEYADFTGGDVYATGPDGLDPLYPRITAQARSQYVLTYYSTNEAPPNRLVFREIDVQSLRGYQVFHRAGYYQVP